MLYIKVSAKAILNAIDNHNIAAKELSELRASHPSKFLSAAYGILRSVGCAKRLGMFRRFIYKKAPSLAAVIESQELVGGGERSSIGRSEIASLRAVAAIAADQCMPVLCGEIIVLFVNEWIDQDGQIDDQA